MVVLDFGFEVGVGADGRTVPGEAVVTSSGFCVQGRKCGRRRWVIAAAWRGGSRENKKAAPVGTRP